MSANAAAAPSPSRALDGAAAFVSTARVGAAFTSNAAGIGEAVRHDGGERVIIV